VRLFIAINLPDAERRSIAEATAPLRDAAPSLGWVDESRLHLTLKFLGEQPDESVGALVTALRGAAARHTPLALEIGGLGAFPTKRRPRVIWLAVAPDPKLELLHHDVEEACAALGYDVEGRAFRPHLTLARVRQHSRGGGAPVDAAAAAALARSAREVQDRWTAEVRSVDLMESVLAKGGPRYSLVDAAPLSGG
jgi:2'-5' RNA ligase